MNKSNLTKAISTALGAGAMAMSSAASADLLELTWDGWFTMQTASGAVLANSSLPSGDAKNPLNQAQTPITGTMQFDTVSGAGTATLDPFDFFDNVASAPAEAVGINFQAIGDGAGGMGSLVMGNMLFNWNGSNGIPVSIVLDAAGFFASQDPGAVGAFGDGWADGTLDTSDNLIQNTGAVPASDGYYIGDIPGTGQGPGGFPGYLALGPLPIATTAWNTSNSSACLPSDCSDVAVSGVLPLVLDNVDVALDYTANTGSVGGTGADPTGIGGNPMQDGPFLGNSANFDVTSLTITNQTASDSPILPPNCDFDPSGNLCAPVVPVPAAVWLFGSGLLGLVGVARRRKS